jgi:TPR repeat protein
MSKLSIDGDSSDSRTLKSRKSDAKLSSSVQSSSSSHSTPGNAGRPVPPPLDTRTTEPSRTIPSASVIETNPNGHQRTLSVEDTPGSPIGVPASQVIMGRKPSQASMRSKEAARKNADEADDLSEDELLVQKGIAHHEAGELEQATECFRRAAEMSNPNGMFLYGISLRHGWGCTPQPTVAFRYLQKAAEAAVGDLNNLEGPNALMNLQNLSGKGVTVAKKELVLAIHELGVCFRHGWGVPKNKQTAVYYFELAANMGDPDAQNDLGFCYYHGEGVKRDLYKAAKYYRMAHKQGVSAVGNSWIFKKKYDSCGV